MCWNLKEYSLISKLLFLGKEEVCTNHLFYLNIISEIPMGIYQGIATIFGGPKPHPVSDNNISKFAQTLINSSITIS